MTGEARIPMIGCLITAHRIKEGPRAVGRITEDLMGAQTTAASAMEDLMGVEAIIETEVLGWWRYASSCPGNCCPLRPAPALISLGREDSSYPSPAPDRESTLDETHLGRLIGRDRSPGGRLLIRGEKGARTPRTRADQ